jgi:hypothetical protein
MDAADESQMRAIICGWLWWLVEAGGWPLFPPKRPSPIFHSHHLAITPPLPAPCTPITAIIDRRTNDDCGYSNRTVTNEGSPKIRLLVGSRGVQKQRH